MDLSALIRLVPKRAGAVDILVITFDDGGNMLTMAIHIMMDLVATRLE